MQMNLSRRISNTRIGTRLALSYGMILFIMIITLAYTSYSMYKTHAETNEAFVDNSGKIFLFNDISNSVHVMLREMRFIMILPADSPAVAVAHKKIEEAQNAYSFAINKSIETMFTETSKVMLRKIDAAVKKSLALNEHVLLLNAEGKHAEAVQLLQTEAAPAGEEALAAITEYLERRKERVVIVKEETEQAIRKAATVALSLTFLVLLLTAYSAVLITRSIINPLNTLKKAINDVSQGASLDALAQINTQDEFSDMGIAVNRVLQEHITARENEVAAREREFLLRNETSAREHAESQRREIEAENDRLNNSVIALLQAVDKLSQRDLSVRAPVSTDIIGTVSDSINQLTEETVKVLHGVNLIASQVALASDKVRSQAELVSLTSEEERKNVDEMILTMGEATETSNQIAELADQSNRSAERATQVTNTALTTVNSTVKGMESIRETIAETEKRIKRLGERSQEISGIVNLINTISERTHVLALNASMQAAVAGDAGRGFAVVAEEVQRLAESSRNASQQIGTLVSNIQLETNETISTVNRTIGQVVLGSEQAQKAGEQMRITQEITGELVEQVRLITEASALQKEMSAQLLESVQRMSQSNERTTQQIVTQSLETQTLQDSARQLLESVNVFKLPTLA